MTNTPATVANVEAILASKGFPVASAKRYGTYVQCDSYHGLVVLWTRDPGESAPRPVRCEALFRIREALLPTFGVQPTGKHYRDGGMIGMLVVERTETTEQARTVVSEVAHA